MDRISNIYFCNQAIDTIVRATGDNRDALRVRWFEAGRNVIATVSAAFRCITAREDSRRRPALSGDEMKRLAETV